MVLGITVPPDCAVHLHFAGGRLLYCCDCDNSQRSLGKANVMFVFFYQNANHFLKQIF